MSPVTSNTVVGVFNDADQARSAVTELRQAGFPQDSISMVIRSDGSDRQGEPTPDVIEDAEIGAAAGGIGGALFAFAAVAVPGLGPIMAIGPILGALGGASLGAVTGGLVGALTNLGVPEAKARDYAESVRRGDAIVTVRTDPAGVERALRIMNECGALDMGARAAGWREGGLVGHNPGVEPLSEEELRREREYAAAGHRVAEWEPETDQEKRHAGQEPGTLWPHEDVHDLGQDLVDMAEHPKRVS
jgi:uncharacterized membrane protein